MLWLPRAHPTSYSLPPRFAMLFAPSAPTLLLALAPIFYRHTIPAAFSHAGRLSRGAEGEEVPYLWVVPSGVATPLLVRLVITGPPKPGGSRQLGLNLSKIEATRAGLAGYINSKALDCQAFVRTVRFDETTFWRPGVDKQFVEGRGWFFAGKVEGATLREATREEVEAAGFDL
jgi:hypothetical protein